ncbi:helix-turn-helix domain-containing protein [bacterium]|nr:helix-turn-helix domain-containing protein [bacterium]
MRKEYLVKIFLFNLCAIIARKITGEIMQDKFQKKLKELRRVKNLTQEAFAKIANFPVTTIAKMEIGVREISATDLAKIARKFDFGMSWFYSPSDLDEFYVSEAMRLMPFRKYIRVIELLEAELLIQMRKERNESVKIKLNELMLNLSNLKVEDLRIKGKL